MTNENKYFFCEINDVLSTIKKQESLMEVLFKKVEKIEEQIHKLSSCRSVDPSPRDDCPAVLLAAKPETSTKSGINGSCWWVDVRTREIPPGAVAGGSENEEPLYVGRALYNGSLIPGKIVQSHEVCYFPSGGVEHSKSDYQVLCGTAPYWIKTRGACIPSIALRAGQTDKHEDLFVGRVTHDGKLMIGKVQPSEGVCCIPYRGDVFKYEDYEILVSK